MAVKKVTNVNKILEEVKCLQKKLADGSTNKAGDQSKGSAKMFLKSIGDNKLKLKDNVIEDKNRAILLLFVNNLETETYEVLAVCYSKVRKAITDITCFDFRNTEQIENYIDYRILDVNYMGKVADICSHTDGIYLFEDGIIYSLDEKGDSYTQAANLNAYAIDKVMDILKNSEQDNEAIYNIEINNVKYAAINKEYVFAMLGKNKCRICSILAKLGYIYTNLGGKKTRYYYRERTKVKNEENEINYFAINMEKLASAMEESGKSC